MPVRKYQGVLQLLSVANCIERRRLERSVSRLPCPGLVLLGHRDSLRCAELAHSHKPWHQAVPRTTSIQAEIAWRYQYARPHHCSKQVTETSPAISDANARSESKTARFSRKTRMHIRNSTRAKEYRCRDTCEYHARQTLTYDESTAQPPISETILWI
ncbi:hypothetical protein EJ02DRAFT_454639, partial [Clathrospora elynae]